MAGSMLILLVIGFLVILLAVVSLVRLTLFGNLFLARVVVLPVHSQEVEQAENKPSTEAGFSFSRHQYILDILVPTDTT